MVTFFSNRTVINNKAVKVSAILFNQIGNKSFKLHKLVVQTVFILLTSFSSWLANAQSNANCYGPYNATPAPVWGIAEKFQTSVGIWNGGTPTAADLNGDGISELLVPASDQSGYYVYKGDGSNKTTATKNYVISNIGRYKSSQPAIANIITATATPEVVMIDKTGFVYI
ncbi:MAG: hypothetical protein KA521_11050, partial [Crocinitomicaceae bacterium]|nr:hypothetical protein [Crocinitomicaceae bacterium]